MSGFEKETTIEDSGGLFQATHWSLIQTAKTHNQDRRKASVNNLISRYWKPVYWYLRCKGHNNEEAEDLTQGFFHEIVLGRQLIQQADQTKGRFRTFLLTALDRYVTSAFRKETSIKRFPRGGISLIEAAELPGMPLAKLKNDPNQVFHYIWATNILDRVLEQIKEDYCKTERAAFWGLFLDRILSPVFNNTEAPSLIELCKKYGIDSEKKASNMIITVKRRFSTALRSQLRQYVQNDSEIEEELCELIVILSKGGAA
jgi:DNA-directed RNA polymerase specialized sigma24 family protein